MNLIVTDIERITVRAPMTPRCEEWNAREVWQWCICEIIRLTTDAGIVGYGETLPHYTWGRVSDEAIARVKGKNAADFLGDDSLGAGLQMAIYDVVGKALGVPAYRLFNQPKVREAVPIAWWNIDFPPEALAEEAKDALAKGYTALKTKARPWWDVYEQVAQMSAVTPPHFKIDMDWNQMLINASNAAPVLNELDKEERVALYESPIFQRDTEGQRLQIVGAGITTALSIQLGVVLPMAQWPAVNCLNNYADDLIVNPIQVTEGYAHVPDAPGLGIEVDEAALAKYKMEPPYEIPRPKLLLSITWPGNRVRHYANMPQCWTDAFAGNIPVQDRGARMVVRADDGSPGWTDLYTRAMKAPFWSSSL